MSTKDILVLINFILIKDYQVAVQGVYKRLERDQAINYIIGEVHKSIGPNQVNHSITDSFVENSKIKFHVFNYFKAKRSISIWVERSKRTFAKVCWHYLKRASLFRVGKQTKNKFLFYIKIPPRKKKFFILELYSKLNK